MYNWFSQRLPEYKSFSLLFVAFLIFHFLPSLMFASTAHSLLPYIIGTKVPPPSNINNRYNPALKTRPHMTILTESSNIFTGQCFRVSEITSPDFPGKPLYNTVSVNDRYVLFLCLIRFDIFCLRKITQVAKYRQTYFGALQVYNSFPHSSTANLR